MRILIQKSILSGALVVLATGCSPRNLLKMLSSEPSADETAHDKDHLDIELQNAYLQGPQPNPEQVRAFMMDAAEEFGVPAEILMAIGQVETNWTQIGPSIDYGWGIMHLVENHYADTLGMASELLGVSRQTLKDDPKQNIRGAAALLADRAGKDRQKFGRLEDWFEATKFLTGLSGEDLQEMQAKNYFKVLKDGTSSPTIFGKKVNILPNPKIDITPYLKPKALLVLSNEYPSAVSQFTTCNFTNGRKGQKIDTWTNHYIGTGTYAGAISWFKKCRGNAGSSAHFVISKEGEISQVVSVDNAAWHAGSSKYGNNNHRSIGVEHESTSTHPEYWQSEAMLKASTDLARYFADKLSIPKIHVTKGEAPEKAGIRGHQEMPGTATSCPGKLPWDKWMQMLKQGQSDTPPTSGGGSGETGGETSEDKATTPEQPTGLSVSIIAP